MNPIYKPYCWWQGHEWVDDPFLGDGKECERCGAMTPTTSIRRTIVDDALMVLIGAMSGIVLGIVIGAQL